MSKVIQKIKSLIAGVLILTFFIFALAMTMLLLNYNLNGILNIQITKSG